MPFFKQLILFLELIESAVYLYQATKDPFLLEIGIDMLEAIEHSTKTKCGYATVSILVFLIKKSCLLLVHVLPHDLSCLLKKKDRFECKSPKLF